MFWNRAKAFVAHVRKSTRATEELRHLQKQQVLKDTPLGDSPITNPELDESDKNEGEEGGGYVQEDDYQARSPRTPRRCIHSQLPLRSIFCRPGWMLRQFLSTCKLPLQSYANKRSPGSTGGAETQVTHQQFTHAQQSTTGKTLWRERMNYNPNKRIQH